MKRTVNSVNGGRAPRRFSGVSGLWAAALLSAAFLPGGCGKEPVPGADKGDLVAIHFGMEGLSKMHPASRATLEENTTVRVIAYKSNASNPAQANYVADLAYCWDGSKLVPCKVDANGQKTDDAVGQVMQVEVGSYDFYALSPALPLNDDKTTLATAVGNQVDYAVSKTTHAIPKQLVPYVFDLEELERRCARVGLVIEPNPQYVGAALGVNSVTVTGLAVPQNGVAVGADLASPSSGTEALTLPAEDFSGSDAAFTSKEYILLPLGGATLTFVFDMTVNGTQKSFTADLREITLAKSTKYTITATIDNESKITLSADPWENDEGNEPDFGGYPYVVDGNIIVLQDRYGSAEGYPLHMPWRNTPAHYEDVWDANTSGVNTVSRRLEVAPADAVLGTHKLHTWYQAYGLHPATYKACENDGWRLPTVREMRLIYDMRDQLTSATLSSENAYWTATVGTSTSKGYAWVVPFSNGNPSKDNTSDTRSVRCVRDIE